MRARAPRFATPSVLCLVLFGLSACTTNVDPNSVNSELAVGYLPPIGGISSELYVRRQLVNGRMLVSEGRLEAAARVTARGLEADPDSAKLHRLRAEVMASLGDAEAARVHRAHADRLAPPAPLPNSPLTDASRGVLVAVLPPPKEAEGERIPRAWPDGAVAQALRERLAVRLPAANVSWVDHVPAPTLPDVRAWIEAKGAHSVLSLRIDRAFCGSSHSDGRFGVVWIRFATANAAESVVAATHREVIEDIGRYDDCRVEALARGLEAVFAKPEVRAALDSRDGLSVAPPSTSPATPSKGSRDWTRNGLLSLFPALERRRDEAIDTGRQKLAQGDLAAAATQFQRALAIDPGDIDAQSHLAEVEIARTLSRELSEANRPAVGMRSTASADDPDTLDLHYSADERHVVEELLRDARRRQEDLLAALIILEGDQELPGETVLARLRPSEIEDREATGPRLARSQAGGEVEVRLLFAPDGSILARYYFDASRGEALLREEDRNDDGEPDRWIAYSGAVRRETWEDREGTGRPDLHVVFADDGFLPKTVEVDSNQDGRVDQVFIYEGDRLTGETRDTDLDGNLDCFEHFDQEGALTRRDEDFDEDGEIDVRTNYRSGRMVHRVIVNPEAAKIP